MAYEHRSRAEEDIMQREQEVVTRAGKVRINVNLSERSYHTLKNLAGESGMDMSDLVRNALRVYTTLLEERKQGKTIYIGTRDKIEKELLMP